MDKWQEIGIHFDIPVKLEKERLIAFLAFTCQVFIDLPFYL